MFCLSLFSRIIQTNTKATWKSWVVLHFLVFLLFLLFFAFYVLELGLVPRTLHMRVTFLSTYLVLLKMEKIKCELEKHGKNQCELEKHEHQLSCLLPSVRSPQLGGMWVLIFLEYMNSDVFVLSNKTLGTFSNQNYCKLYQTNIETNLDSTWIKVQHKSNKQQQKYYLMLISKFYQVHIRQLVP